MADKLGLVDGEARELKLGGSFKSDGSVAFHSLRYDFKPASVDTSKMASLEVGENHSISVTVPHVEGSGTTLYKGNKRPIQKECVLIIDHATGEICLEKLSSSLQLKKTRREGTSKASNMGRPLTPSEQMMQMQKMKSSPKKKQPKPGQKPGQGEPQVSQASVAPAASKKEGRATPEVKPEVKAPSPPPLNPAAASPVAEMSDSSSSASESLSSDSETEETKIATTNSSASQPTPQSQPSLVRNRYPSLLKEDLRLSDSGSDSD